MHKKVNCWLVTGPGMLRSVKIRPGIPVTRQVVCEFGGECPDTATKSLVDFRAAPNGAYVEVQGMNIPGRIYNAIAHDSPPLRISPAQFGTTEALIQIERFPDPNSEVRLNTDNLQVLHCRTIPTCNYRGRYDEALIAIEPGETFRLVQYPLAGGLPRYRRHFLFTLGEDFCLSCVKNG